MQVLASREAVRFLHSAAALAIDGRSSIGEADGEADADAEVESLPSDVISRLKEAGIRQRRLRNRTTAPARTPAWTGGRTGARGWISHARGTALAAAARSLLSARGSGSRCSADALSTESRRTTISDDMQHTTRNMHHAACNIG